MNTRVGTARWKAFHVTTKRRARSSTFFTIQAANGASVRTAVDWYAGRLFGAFTFIALAIYVSEEAALRYAIILIALLQLCSIFVAKRLLRGNAELSKQLPADKPL